MKINFKTIFSICALIFIAINIQSCSSKGGVSSAKDPELGKDPQPSVEVKTPNVDGLIASLLIKGRSQSSEYDASKVFPSTSNASLSFIALGKKAYINDDGTKKTKDEIKVLKDEFKKVTSFVSVQPSSDEQSYGTRKYKEQSAGMLSFFLLSVKEQKEHLDTWFVNKDDLKHSNIFAYRDIVVAFKAKKKVVPEDKNNFSKQSQQAVCDAFKDHDKKQLKVLEPRFLKIKNIGNDEQKRIFFINKTGKLEFLTAKNYSKMCSKP